MVSTLGTQPPSGKYVDRFKALAAAFLLASSSFWLIAPAGGIELNKITHPDFVPTLAPNDPCVSGCLPYGVPWHFESLGAQSAWDITTGASEVTVAIVDTGIDTAHPDLIGRVRSIPGCGLGPNVAYDTSHGTFIAGLIGAASDNSIGTAGLDWNTDLLDVRVMKGSSGSTSDIADGIRCAARHGADVITLSFVQAGTQLSPVLEDAINEAVAAGALIIAAAGNDGDTRQRFPAAAAGVLSVGAIDETLSVATFSNRGDWVDLMAPGVRLLSLGSGLSNGVRLGQGTSFAAPLVAATASLVKARFPYFDASQISRQLLRSAQPHTDTNTQLSYKILNAERAVTLPYRTHWQVTTAGQVLALGESQHFGDLTDGASVRDVVAIAANASGLGYWLARSSGVTATFGDALSLGDLAQVTLNKPIVDMAVTPSGNGYWLVASDGGIFTFGDAGFHGSTGAMTLNQPIVGIGVTPSGNGYWLVASDGGIFTFGDAGFHGSTGAMTLNQPITSVIQTRLGYDLVAADGGVFNFNSPFLGSGASRELRGSIVDASSRVGGW